jgi:ATP-dependent RNA helicase RhlE
MTLHDQENDNNGFRQFGFSEGVMEGLESIGFATPTPIQTQIIPHVMAGHDVVGCAQTGTGKTAAYLLPILHRIIEKRVEGINTIIIAPTRELAVQIAQQLEGFSYFLHISSLPVYGGTSSFTTTLPSSIFVYKLGLAPGLPSNGL